VLFQVPSPDSGDPAACLDGEHLADCFHGIVDLGALDMVRALDHGIPGYNALRVAYGLAPVSSFADLTGEATQEMPDGLGIDDPAILDFVDLRDSSGAPVEAGDPEGVAVTDVRRTTVAARLAAIYGDVADVDAFTGMLTERHAPGAELGELQLAMWQHQFAALRDGDRFFYSNDPVLTRISDTYGIDFRRSLADVIDDNTAGDPAPADVFHVVDAVPVPAPDAAEPPPAAPPRRPDRPRRPSARPGQQAGPEPDGRARRPRSDNRPGR
jgi:hypothetical protein